MFGTHGPLDVSTLDGDDDMTAENENQPGLRRATVPARLHLDFANMTAQWCHRQRAIIHGIVVQAAGLALAGHPDPRLLPPKGTGASGSWRESVRVKWIQCDVEYGRCVDLIEGAGSTVPLVIAAGMQAYIEAGGDVVAMTAARVGQATARRPPPASV